MDAGWGETPLSKGTLGFIPLYTANMSWRDFGTGTIDVTA